MSPEPVIQNIVAKLILSMVENSHDQYVNFCPFGCLSFFVYYVHNLNLHQAGFLLKNLANRPSPHEGFLSFYRQVSAICFIIEQAIKFHNIGLKAFNFAEQKCQLAQ